MRANWEAPGRSRSITKPATADPFEFKSENGVTWNAQSRKLEDNLDRLCKKQARKFAQLLREF